MARLRIVELPMTGYGDNVTTPFVVVLDQVGERSPFNTTAYAERLGESAKVWGGRGALVTTDTIELAGELPPAEPLELVSVELDEAERYKQDHLNACKTIADMHAAATGRTGMGPVRGVVEDVADVRQRAEAAEAKLEEVRRIGVERMDAITDALGFDRLRDWGEIVSAIKLQRRMDAEGGHLFGEPGFRDPLRCARCRIFHTDWVRRGTRCEAVRAENGGE